jgi:SAM-dependent methyltransferase
VHGYGPSTYGDSFADVYDEWYPATDPDIVNRLAELAGDGPTLELGAGTGRIAIPLAARGIAVWALDASAAMADRLRAKPGAERVNVVVGDMAALEATLAPDTPPFSLVFAVANTVFNLTSEDDQRACLRQVAARLAYGGRLLIEAVVPAPDGPTSAVEASIVTSDSVVLSVSTHDRGAQTVTGQHVQIGSDGVRLRPWVIRYLTPDQLDAIAAEAGLRLENRWRSWDGAPFAPDGGSHISVFSAR